MIMRNIRSRLLPLLTRISSERLCRMMCIAGVGLFLVMVEPVRADSAQFDWHDWDVLLHQYVVTGKRQGITSNLVDYEALAADKKFYAIARALQHYDPSTLNADELEAFYINAYNYFAVYLVVSHWPVNSIRDIGNLFWPVWYRNVGQINGQDISLNEIENDILRPMHDPRIHFAIVCASMSCPNLRKEAYDSARLDGQLKDQIDELLANDEKGVKIAGDQVTVSSLFEWYESDFNEQGGVIAFLQQYVRLPANVSRLEYLPYNWHVNAQVHPVSQ